MFLLPVKIQESPNLSFPNFAYSASSFPPPPPPSLLHDNQKATQVYEPEAPTPEPENPENFCQHGKIFIGNLPFWIKNMRNVGFGFVIYGGAPPVAEKSTVKVVEFDGVEFHGRVLTVKLDDGTRLKGKAEERAIWVEGLIHAYAVGRDMEEALSCVRKMKEEGIEMTVVTYNILVGGFAKVGNSETLAIYYFSEDYWFEEAKKIHTHLNAIIYGNIVYAHCQACNMERAEALVREMEEEGISAPIEIYHTMMDGYTMIGNEEKCLIVFERLKCLHHQGLWLFFDKYGEVVDSFILNKRSKGGSRFGFVRFTTLEDTRKAINCVDRSWIQGNKVRVFMARYHPRDVFWRNKFSDPYPVEGKSLVEDASHTEAPIVGSVDEDKLSTLKDNMVGWCRNFIKMKELAAILHKEGIVGPKIMRLNGLAILILFEDAESRDFTLHNQIGAFNKCFDIVEVRSKDFKCSSCRAWLSCKGIPPLFKVHVSEFEPCFSPESVWIDSSSMEEADASPLSKLGEIIGVSPVKYPELEVCAEEEGRNEISSEVKIPERCYVKDDSVLCCMGSSTCGSLLSGEGEEDRNIVLEHAEREAVDVYNESCLSARVNEGIKDYLIDFPILDGRLTSRDMEDGSIMGLSNEELLVHATREKEDVYRKSCEHVLALEGSKDYFKDFPMLDGRCELKVVEDEFNEGLMNICAFKNPKGKARQNKRPKEGFDKKYNFVQTFQENIKAPQRKSRGYRCKSNQSKAQQDEEVSELEGSRVFLISEQYIDERILLFCVLVEQQGMGDGESTCKWDTGLLGVGSWDVAKWYGHQPSSRGWHEH
ncbi:hypothetical protein F3Y22_tig00111105pilonHSYRG00836 [Hibiscus syriacus]|uniref:RRM domain-containing protein n=1 Tax=Hibiscus syriacus TaxID=106335 RepID=A0A6A2YZQ9_HIBSY|nr:hypothetical protein F3Y22_tig00111105pilonHSYRG00836 [Hibiscus syriacus]